MTSVASNTSAASAETRQIVLKEIRATWGKFSEQDLSALRSNDDLVTQVVAKYSREPGQVQRDVDALLKGRQLLLASRHENAECAFFGCGFGFPSRDNSMLPIVESQMTAFNYNSVAELFPSKTDVELFPAKRRRVRRQPIGYGRFARAGYAIRFAIEELPTGLLLDTCLKVDETIFDRDGIRRLYDGEGYPLVRRAPTR